MTDTQKPIEYSPEDLALLKRKICKGFTDDNIKLYLRDCNSRTPPVDAFAGKIHPTQRKDKNSGELNYAPITSIDYFFEVAEEKLAGLEPAQFTGKPQTKDWDCTVTIHKLLVNGQTGKFSASANWGEYYPGDGAPGFFWRKMPKTMLEKVAQSKCLRKGFSKQLHGLYTHEEMAQAAPQGPDLGDALRQDFPVNADLHGTVMNFKDSTGTNPAFISIQGDNGTSAYEVLNLALRDNCEVGDRVIFQFDKKPGNRAILTALRKAESAAPPIAKSESPRETLLEATEALLGPLTIDDTPDNAALDAAIIDEEEGWIYATVEKVLGKTGRPPNKLPYSTLILAVGAGVLDTLRADYPKSVNVTEGTFSVNAFRSPNPDKDGFAAYDELLGVPVRFKVEANNGWPNLTSLELDVVVTEPT